MKQYVENSCFYHIQALQTGGLTHCVRNCHGLHIQSCGCTLSQLMFVCPKCEHTDKESRRIGTHAKYFTSPAVTKQYKCQYCIRTFDTIAGWQVHTSTQNKAEYNLKLPTKKVWTAVELMLLAKKEVRFLGSAEILLQHSTL